MKSVATVIFILLLVSVMGQVIRIEVDGVKRMGRSTEGVRLMDVGDEDSVVTCAPVDEQEAAAGAPGAPEAAIAADEPASGGEPDA